MYRYLIIAAMFATAASMATAATRTDANQPAQVRKFTGEEFAKDARVTLDQARSIALKARPGKVTDQELEKEKGGSGLRYSFDIKDAAGTHEVGVDAKTGKVLENKLEGPGAD